MTTGPAAAIGFVRAGVQVASVDIPGHLLEIELPKSVEMRRLSSGGVQIVESSDPLLECCGRLTIPWVDKYGPHVTYLDVPPPTPFTDGDVGAMWEARNRLSVERRPPTSGNVAWSELKGVLQGKIDWESMEFAVTTARRLIATWPSNPEPAIEWRPVDRPGGRVLVGVTERNAANHARPAGSTKAPSVTARRTTVSRDRTLHALAAVAAILADRLNAMRELDSMPEIRDGLSGLFRRVAQRSSPSKPLADPPPSTWPPAFARTYSAILRALATLEATGSGSNHSPLSELWELYQAWAAVAVRDAMRAELGPPKEGSVQGSCLGRWQDGDGCVELHYQAYIPAERGSLTVLGRTYVAAIGALSPDLIVLRSEGSSHGMLVLDAKKRNSGMLTEDLTVNASKYLWGIRRTDTPDVVPAILGAIMLTPLGGTRPKSGIGLADVYRAHPAVGVDALFIAGLLNLLRGGNAPAGNFAGVPGGRILEAFEHTGNVDGP